MPAEKGLKIMNGRLTTKEELWARHDQGWRDPAQVISQWEGAHRLDRRLLHYTVKGDWWDLLHQLGTCLLISREYEHLMISLGATAHTPEISSMCIPHPSGIAVNRKKNLIYIASTRNPNQIFELGLSKGIMDRKDFAGRRKALGDGANVLVPRRTFFYPGSLYIHDLAVIGNDLYANAVGHNAVVQLFSSGGYQYVWWPLSMENGSGPRMEANYIQLNSIAAGKTIQDSFFSASANSVSQRRPGHINFAVDKRGVIFSGKTRQPICYGLTRPHSARCYQGKIWVDNSGYGEFGYIEEEKFVPIVSLPGWTRGLFIDKGIAFVGTSKVIPRFYRYAPGLDIAKSRCGVHAVDLKTGKIVGSIQWPYGNQVFAIEGMPRRLCRGFAHEHLSSKTSRQIKNLFYAFKTHEE